MHVCPHFFLRIFFSNLHRSLMPNAVGNTSNHIQNFLLSMFFLQAKCPSFIFTAFFAQFKTITSVFLVCNYFWFQADFNYQEDKQNCGKLIPQKKMSMKTSPSGRWSITWFIQFLDIFLQNINFCWRRLPFRNFW